MPCAAELFVWMGCGALSLPLSEQDDGLVGSLTSLAKVNWGGGMTHKKNLGSPLTTARTSASLSVGFFGIGLQKAKGSQQASWEVR